MKSTLKSALLIATVIFGAGMGCIMMSGCEEKPKSFKEEVKDGLDARPNEKIKDAAEDAKDAVKDAADDVKDAVKN